MILAGIRFKEDGKVYNFKSDIELAINDEVVVNTERGIQYGFVNSVGELKTKFDEYMSVLRIASDKDRRDYKKNLEDSIKALDKARELAEELDLTMNFIDSYFTLDRSQLLFYFIADNRVDFRDLAKELANIYKTRIELRQVGVRDKAKEVSGVGVCGRKLCCSCFLNNMDSVSISMAKNQNLSLNPSKINGLCGRLLCCLNYEDELYCANKKGMPHVGQNVETEFGEGVVTSVNIPIREYSVYVENHGKVDIKLSESDGCGKCGKCHK